MIIYMQVSSENKINYRNMKKNSIAKLALLLLLVWPLSVFAQLVGAGHKLTQEYGIIGFIIFIVIFGLVAYNKFKDNQK